jgi:hypothetical protein
MNLFARTMKGTAIGVFYGVCDYLDRIARKTVMQLGVADRIKQRWRARLQGKATNGCGWGAEAGGAMSR